MKKKLIHWSLTAVLATICFTGISLAESGNPIDYFSGNVKSCPEITLSASQRTLFLDARKDYREKMIRLEAKRALVENRKDRIMAGKDISFDRLKKLANERNAFAGEMAIVEIDTMAIIKEGLTPDQWKKYLDVRVVIDSLDMTYYMAGEEPNMNDDRFCIDIEETHGDFLFAPLF